MARTTASKVKEILNTSLSVTKINAFITAANALVTNTLGTDTTLGDTLKEEIERWLTAHLIVSARERQGIKEGAGGAEITYQGKTGIGLDSTMYGQNVKVLDTTGRMAALSSGKAVLLTAVTSFE